VKRKASRSIPINLTRQGSTKFHEHRQSNKPTGFP
jgi:hypothetical protein